MGTQTIKSIAASFMLTPIIALEARVTCARHAERPEIRPIPTYEWDLGISFFLLDPLDELTLLSLKPGTEHLIDDKLVPFKRWLAEFIVAKDQQCIIHPL